jgi:hypothetical protein
VDEKQSSLEHSLKGLSEYLGKIKESEGDLEFCENQDRELTVPIYGDQDLGGNPFIVYQDSDEGDEGEGFEEGPEPRFMGKDRISEGNDGIMDYNPYAENEQGEELELEDININEDDSGLRGNIGRNYRDMGQKNRYDAEGSDHNGSGSGSKIDLFQNEKIISDSMRKKDYLKTQTHPSSSNPNNQHTEATPPQDPQHSRPSQSRNHKKLAHIINTELTSKYPPPLSPSHSHSLSPTQNDGLEEPISNDEQNSPYDDNSPSFNPNQNLPTNVNPDQVDNIIKEFSNLKRSKGQTYDMFSNQ